MAGRVPGNGGHLHTERASDATVLVVDEELNDTCEFCTSLRHAGYAVCCVRSFTEGVACLDRGPIEFAIVSQGSPAFEGRRVLERAIDKDPRTPVLVLTRSVDMGSYLEAMQLGALDYMEKPVSANEVLKLVAIHIRSRNQAVGRVSQCRS